MPSVNPPPSRGRDLGLPKRIRFYGRSVPFMVESGLKLQHIFPEDRGSNAGNVMSTTSILI
jgi:hypothetical protein